MTDLTSALDALHRGLVIGFPTDTVYGIGVDPENERALRRVFAVTGRPDDKAWIGDPHGGTVAIRVPNHPLALAVLARFGPLAVTSANRSGEEPAGDDVAACAALGAGVAVYLPGGGGGGAASTVVDLTGRTTVVLRPGPVAWEP